LADRLSFRLGRRDLLFSHHNFAFFGFVGFFGFRFFGTFFQEMFQFALGTGRAESLQEIWKKSKKFYFYDLIKVLMY
jgi:hypothetical protein